MLNERLRQFFKDNKKVALGFSGGVDSSYLLYAGVKSGADIRPYFVKSQFQPAFELEDAKRLAKTLGVTLRVIELDVLSNQEIRNNPQNRCYYCKNTIFQTLIQEAKKEGYSLIIDGTNASDQVDDRPGIKALRELKVRSPLREVGLTKAEIRELSKKAGLFTWDKPSYACLATRIMTDQKIEKEDLERVEKAEKELFDLGFKDFRIRLFHDAAKIEIPEAQMLELLEKKEIVREKLSAYFKLILLDLKGRTWNS